jgi:short-subunit dehydrogenase
MSFANGTAVITGASSGIGAAVARVLANQGCRVGLLARRRELLDELTAGITAAGGVALAVAADVTDREQTRAAVRTITEKLGPVDLMLANAGVSYPSEIEPMNVEELTRQMEVNYVGVLHAIDAVLPAMLERGDGHLAAMASLAGYTGMPGSWGYSSSKAAVINLMEGLRIQLRRHGIAVTTICPGFVRTPMTDVHLFKMPFLLEADDAARRIVRALERRRGVYNFPWQMALLLRLARWLPDRLIRRIVEPRATARSDRHVSS